MNRLLPVLSLFFLLTSHSSAAVVFDSGGFEGYTIGDVLGQPAGDPPADRWVDFNAPSGAGRFNVQNAITNGGSRALAASSASDIAAFVAPAVNFTPAAGERVLVEVDIARTRALLPFQNNSNGFNVDIYNAGANRIAGFGIDFGNIVANQFTAFVTRGGGGPNGTSDAIPLAIDIVDPGTQRTEFLSFRAELDFDTDTFNLSTSGMNGTVNTGTLNFVNASTVLADADLQHDTFQRPNSVDVGYFDNYRITTVPEPGSLAGCLTLLSGALLRRRRF